jgi:hypothetical protein
MSPQSVLDAVLRLVQTVSDITVALNRFLPARGEPEQHCRKLIEEILTLGGATNSMKTLLEDNIQRDGPDEYKERVSKLEEIWVPDGSMTECTQRMDNILAELNKAIKDNAQLEPEKKIPWPLERDATIVHIERMQVYKKAITSAIYANYNDM